MHAEVVVDEADPVNVSADPSWLRGFTFEGGSVSGEEYHCHHTVGALETQANARTPALHLPASLACTGHHASGILPYDAWIPGRLFFGACSNIYGSDSHNRISRRSRYRS